MRKQYKDLSWVGDFILRERGAKGWSREQLSRFSGVSKDQVKKYEIGTSNPNFETAQILLNKFGAKLVVVFKDE